MSRPRFDPRRQRPTGPRVNDRIRVPQVRVIAADGEQLGILDTDEAKRLARTSLLDLVEVNPKAQPPVCKIMDFGRFKYEEKKKANDAKKRQVKVELKEVKLRPKTDDHDLDFKTKHVRRFLEEGNKVKITVRFRGREITHPETAIRQIEAIIQDVADISFVEANGRMEGRAMTAMLAPRQKPTKKVEPAAKPPAAEGTADKPTKAPARKAAAAKSAEGKAAPAKAAPAKAAPAKAAPAKAAEGTAAEGKAAEGTSAESKAKSADAKAGKPAGRVADAEG